MKVENISRRVITDDEGREISQGAMCDVLTGDFPILATFEGLTQRGAMIFKGAGKFENVTFKIMPKSIKEIYVRQN